MDTKISNKLKIIDKFYSAEIQNSPEKLLPLLKKLVDFDNGYIYLSDRVVYKITHSDTDSKYMAKENLQIKNSVFGHIEIYKNKRFTKEEKDLFKTCSMIISSIIKDYELSKIINMQLDTLQEGIKEKDLAYKSAKTKNDFFSNFSHEIRTPLNSIISSSEILSEKIFGNLTKKQEEYISDIRVAGLHLLGMINDILDLSKLEANLMKLNKTEFKITRLLSEIQNIVLPIAQKKNISLKINLKENISINADYQKLQQILFNLISNAIKYTPEKGHVEVSAKKNGNYVCIAVKDNGIGIEKENQQKIFKKFVQLNPQKDSSGLGLTITKELVSLHNGKISVKSKTGQGTTFTVELPELNKD